MKYFIYDTAGVKEVASKNEFDAWEKENDTAIYPEIQLNYKDVSYSVYCFFDGEYDDSNNAKFMPFGLMVSENIDLSEAQMEEIKEDEFWSDGENIVTKYATLEEAKKAWQETALNMVYRGDVWPRFEPNT